MRWYLKFTAPVVAFLAAIAGVAPASATAGQEPSSGISFAGPVIPLDMKRNTEIFAGGLYLDQTTDAVAATARLQAAGKTQDAAMMRQISEQPTAVWIGEWFTGALLKSQLAKHVAAAKKQGKTPVFVTYAIPNRDCGGHSAGGLSPAAYLDWNRTVANSLAGTGAVVLVEPDALAMLTNGRCPGENERRLSTMRQAVDILAGAGLSLYLDAGNSAWADVDEMAALLRAAGVFEARGFITNVSNFRRVDEERAYDEKLSKALGGKSYVIDVSRNGNGWRGDWCNPPGAAIGQTPRVTYGTTKLDALLWVKHPGASDGACNGGPAAGKWWESYALDLVRNKKG